MRTRAALLPAMAALAYLSVPAHLHAQAADEVLIGPIDYEQNVNGVPVTVTARTYVRIVTPENKLLLKVRVVGDLSDLQRKIGTIVDTFSLPRDNCRSYSPNNPVVDISRKELRADLDRATFSLGGSVTVWECAENPVANSKVEWEVRKVGLGIKTKVPVIKTWPGSPIKTIFARQGFDVDLPVLLVRSNDHSVGLQFSKPEIELTGRFAFVTKGMLSIAGIDINQKAYDVLQKAIDPQKLILSIPDELEKYNPSVESARLFNDNGKLTAEIALTALVPAETINALITELLNHKK